MWGMRMSLLQVVWAIDPFEIGEGLYVRCEQMLKSLGECVSISVQPVYVLSAGQMSLNHELANEPSVGAFWTNHYKTAAERVLGDAVRPIQLDSIKKPIVLMQAGTSRAEACEVLSDYASLEGADLILASSHGRTGIRRLILGSFAETLLLRSRVPVLLLGAKILERRSFLKLLFCTDFGPYSKVFFRKAVQIAQSFGSDLVLFHSVRDPVEPLVQSGANLLGGSWIPIYYYFAEEVERQTQRARAWARWATARGVVTEAVVHSREGLIDHAVISTAESKKVGCIIMGAQSSQLSATILGSITRQVIRGADCPVWVIRKDQIQKSEVGQLKVA